MTQGQRVVSVEIDAKKEDPKHRDVSTLTSLLFFFLRFCSETMQAFIDMLLVKKDREGALEVVRDAIRRLLTGQVDVSKLVLSKKLSRMKYKTLASTFG